MPPSYADHVREWARDLESDLDLPRARELIEYFAEHLFHEYKPTKTPGDRVFLDRLSDWLNSATDDDDRRVMFQLVTHILFVGTNEFDCLYQAAFNGPIARWLIDSTGLPLGSAQLSDALRVSERETWFCAITDSMQISEFYHINNIEGTALRPVWRTLAEFADKETPARIDEYMRTAGFRRIVLLEDFVGSGTQMAKAVLFAARLPSRFPVLLCPLLICPKGVDKANRLVRTIPHLRFEPVVRIPRELCLGKAPVPGENRFFPALRQAVERQHPRLVNPATRYEPYGFKDTGALVVMHTNTPNNTLPLVHHSSVANQPWSALFRRSSRT
jgi:hypothetical protein